ncbi:helix-turn-helix transcriptional regulator [Enterococcus sp. BWB1-3]|uniref:helix-turn-helix domain-containing protein n=1 Tax=Enterococcus sp. BWB1-3 TaxID=2787713 RepID=UPI001923FFE8|nr:helix-turn-helix transcriptional regulator [Enterococcus sp. BWB1-3]MBL1228790.1 helix-turn-helix transcriptional regulator [Enterococcus sp. BWB1-3]
MYGEIIKKIRKNKGYTQKEVYTGVVSKTFYSDFEAGKYSVEITKFQELINNLGISYEEFEYFRKQNTINEEKLLENQIDVLYKNGKFEELYELYERYHKHQNTEMRHLAMNAYLLVLITNANFYKFSREPFNEILSELENAKMWTLREIKLSKLILLSISENDKDEAEQLYKRILSELKKYKEFNSKLYCEEVGDLHFNRIQSLLMINDIERARETLSVYNELINPSDNLHLLVQLEFINNLVGLYLDFFSSQSKMKALLDTLNLIPSSESKFYTIIFQIHQEKARNYYERYK